MNVTPPVAYGPNAEPQVQTPGQVAQAGKFTSLISAALHFITGGSSGEYIAGVAAGTIPGDITEKNFKDADRAIKTAGLDGGKLEKMAQDQNWDQGKKVNFVRYAAHLGEALENRRLQPAEVKSRIEQWLSR